MGKKKKKKTNTTAGTFHFPSLLFSLDPSTSPSYNNIPFHRRRIFPSHDVRRAVSREATSSEVHFRGVSPQRVQRRDTVHGHHPGPVEPHPQRVHPPNEHPVTPHGPEPGLPGQPGGGTVVPGGPERIQPQGASVGAEDDRRVRKGGYAKTETDAKRVESARDSEPVGACTQRENRPPPSHNHESSARRVLFRNVSMRVY